MKRKSNHTPGPWKHLSFGPNHDRRIIARFDGPNGDEYHSEVATMPYGHYGNSEGRGLSPHVSEANANLIATAPDLYAIVYALEWDCEKDGDAVCSWCDGERPNHTDDCYLKATLKKVEGNDAS